VPVVAPPDSSVGKALSSLAIALSLIGPKTFSVSMSAHAARGMTGVMPRAR
jgi:hypothetical protein